MAEVTLRDPRRHDGRMEDRPNWEIDRFRNLVLKHFDVDHRRWIAASESLKIGHDAIGFPP
jgi:hypothetical protein